MYASEKKKVFELSIIASFRAISPWPPFFHPLYTLPSSGSIKKPGSWIVKSQSIIFSLIPNKPIAGLIVDAGEYLPCAARSKKGLLSSFTISLNSFCERPFAILLTEKDGELT